MVAAATEDAASLPYHDPGIITILVQVSFLLLLNVVNAALDRVLYCGLLGQVLVGVAWGTPGAKWLSLQAEESFVQLGYVGLLLLVYEGGLRTSFPSLKANLLLSSAVALTGIVAPVALSYALQGLLNATPIQAFAAGAALCSTSLGTTFTILGSSGLSASRLGVVLTSAAMMDDVVGLVMVQVISNLASDDFSWVTVVRPVLVSVAFAVIAPVSCLWLVKPVTVWLNSYRKVHLNARLDRLLQQSQTAFAIHTLILISLVTGATYAGTSNLFAAYIAGAAISWWDSEVAHPVPDTSDQSTTIDENTIRAAANANRTSSVIGPATQEESDTSSTPATDRPGQIGEQQGSVLSPQTSRHQTSHQDTSGWAIHQRYYHVVVSKILQPLFFASIGFSIPITRILRGTVVWRGIVYTILMAFGKMLCGLWLVKLPFSSRRTSMSDVLKKVKFLLVPDSWGRSSHGAASTQASTDGPTNSSPPNEASRSLHTSPMPPKPISLHPSLILALAMCARGEIGFLISGVAESSGLFSPSGRASQEPSDIFLVVTWAIVLCTIVGPLGVGLTVRRVRKLQARRDLHQEGAERGVLGVWGLQ